MLILIITSCIAVAQNMCLSIVMHQSHDRYPTPPHDHDPESAGSVSVAFHLLSPLSRNLFTRLDTITIIFTGLNTIFVTTTMIKLSLSQQKDFIPNSLNLLNIPRLNIAIAALWPIYSLKYDRSLTRSRQLCWKPLKSTFCQPAAGESFTFPTKEHSIHSMCQIISGQHSNAVYCGKNPRYAWSVICMLATDIKLTITIIITIIATIITSAHF